MLPPRAEFHFYKVHIVHTQLCTCVFLEVSVKPILPTSATQLHLRALDALGKQQKSLTHHPKWFASTFFSPLFKEANIYYKGETRSLFQYPRKHLIQRILDSSRNTIHQTSNKPCFVKGLACPNGFHT